jgi:DNA-directed RNA polymerase specialized sigma24 family protein
MLGNPDDAKDAEQETFLRTFKALARFKGGVRPPLSEWRKNWSS